MKKSKTVRIRVFGIVQGVGFRPTVSRHAVATHIKGTVCNKGSFVEIWAQGTKEDIDVFCRKIQKEPPQRAVIMKISIEEKQTGFTDFTDFSIIESEKKRGDIFVSPDIGICPQCKKELYDRNDRRYLHPFINCTCCGPRLTILDAMPYDRERTSMAEFPMCPSCEWEYTHAETRRFDAQPVCCNECGPEVYVIGKDFRGPEALRYVRKLLRDGGIAAIKGIGGFHLCCDALNEKTVARLRKSKGRPIKPFAVMMKDMDTVRRECECDEVRQELLEGYQKPILLLEKKEGGRLSSLVAPGNPKVGVMLPYAPLHHLLFDYCDDISVSDCLVMTSANNSGAPICRDDEDAIAELGGLCDVILSHNRLIRLRADDTVMDFFRDGPYVIRRSRGYAPLPFAMERDWKGEVLAMGGELKNTFCVGKNSLFYPSPYVGDMSDVRTVKALDESVKRMTGLLEARPEVVACDLHPAYNTSALAESMGLPVMKIQHHYAHILSCMAENEYPGPVIGVSFDGTGYGTDKTIWGGEFLVSDYDGFSRKASVQSFVQVGGDLAAKEGWRVAVSLLKAVYGEEETLQLSEKWELCTRQEASVLCKMADRGINSIVSTSAGRLFDAVSALLGICRFSTFEGEASISLQFAAQAFEKKVFRSGEGNLGMPEDWDEKMLLTISEKEEAEQRSFFLNTTGLFSWITEQKKQGKASEELSYAFHRILAEMIVQGCIRIREETGITTAALSGGVFQNTLLLRLCVNRLEKENFHVLIHHLIPPNDGGICLGQAVAAMNQLQKKYKKEGENKCV